MVGAPQLVNRGRVDYLVFDYLAETTMAILAAARARNPDLGYATDFVDITMKEVLPEVMRQGIKVVTNAGGINPRGCAEAVRRIAREQGLSPRIAVVDGDDVSAAMPALRDAGTTDMYTGEALPARVLSANAYLGALPIARALDAGADIVITGRCVDSATTLGALIHAFDWPVDDYDLMAAGSLAGHIVECGCQATGGLFTDWESVPDWPNIGYPVIECARDGSFTVTKPEGTGGVILRAALAEQLLYEIGDPGAYQLPDVICDFRNVRIEQLDSEHVRLSGARGLPPTDHYKVSATALDGYRCAGTIAIIGIDAVRKAQRTGEAVIARTRTILREKGLADFTATRIEVIGGETLYGPHGRAGGTREVLVRIVCDHPDKEALKIFAREIMPAGTSWSPGTTTPGGGRTSPSPLIKPFSFTIPKDRAAVSVTLDDQPVPVAIPLPGGRVPAAGTDQPAPWQEPVGPLVEVPLIRLAWARSGDKGKLSNIGVIARRPEWLPMLWARLTPEVVRDYLSHLVKGQVERYYLPGIAAMNLVLHDALDGGGPSSMRLDPLGKGMAQMLLELPIRVPAAMAAELAGNPAP
jgi:hypothetical protein